MMKLLFQFCLGVVVLAGLWVYVRVWMGPVDLEPKPPKRSPRYVCRNETLPKFIHYSWN